MSNLLYGLSPWLQKLLALAILLLLISVLVLWLAQTGIDIAANEQSITHKRQQLARFESFANYVLEQPVQKSGDVHTPGKGEEFLKPELEPVMMAQLQNRLKTIARSQRVKIIAIGSLPKATINDVQYIGLRLSASGTYKSIYGMLLDVETSRPYLFIRQAHIRSSASSVRDPQRDVDISVQLSIYGAVAKSTQTAELANDQ
ncbi:MAG: hypothetical protein GY761_06720 [Hyphomicrobiales bacterium]|nr:hypothetical protein [Hyphomicrobiales bacterium]